MTATTMAKPSPASAPPLKAERRFAWGSPFVYFVIMLACGLSLVPVIYVILGGFRSNGALANRPVDFPDPWITRNYKSVLTSESFWTQVLNSTMIAVTVTAVVVVFGIMAAFVLARYSFPGREAVYAFFTLGLLFPIGVAILPLYLLLMDWNLLNSLWGVIIPTVAVHPQGDGGGVGDRRLQPGRFLLAHPVAVVVARDDDGGCAGLRGGLELVPAPTAGPERSRERHASAGGCGLLDAVLAGHRGGSGIHVAGDAPRAAVLHARRAPDRR
jgi:hypothetical protein